MAKRRAIGRPLGTLDGQIAAIARRRGFTVATRDGCDYEACGVEIVDPFTPVDRGQS
jgi:toxin FitB